MGQARKVVSCVQGFASAPGLVAAPQPEAGGPVLTVGLYHFKLAENLRTSDTPYVNARTENLPKPT